jgi:hypothetical protein
LSTALLVGAALLLGGLPSVPIGGAHVARVPPPIPVPASSPPAPGRLAVPAPSAVIAAPYNLSGALSWSELSASSPGAPVGAGLAAIAPAGDALLFGGQTPTGLSNATLRYNESGNLWTSLTPSLAPSPRSDFGLAADPTGETVVLFGGVTNATTDAVSNATWVFSVAAGTWTNITSALAPAARENAALAVGDGVALLFGGWTQNASGGGETTYSGTWELNLTTDAWTHLAVASESGPGAVHGASMVFDSALGVFLLYGGCYPCSSDVWELGLSSPVWTHLASVGTAPPGRMDAAWVLDTDRQLVILFGGSDGTSFFNDTYLFDPVALRWTAVVSPTAPLARSRAAAGYLSVPGNDTLLLAGGTNGSTPFAGAWRFAPVANLTVLVANNSSYLRIAKATVELDHARPLLTNLSGAVAVSGVAATETVVNVSALGYVNASRALWIPTGANLTLWFNLTPRPSSTILVTITALNGTPLAGAYVNLTIAGKLFGGSPKLTNRSGMVVFLGVPPTRGNLSATLAGFHPGVTPINVLAGTTFPVGLALTPLVELSVRTLGDLPNGTIEPLELVSLSLDFGPGNLTGAGGWRNLTTTLIGPAQLHARVYGFNSLEKNLTLNYTGVVPLVLTLTALPFPTVTVQAFLSSGTGLGQFVRDAEVLVVSDTPLPTGPVNEVLATGLLGTVKFSPVPGNYSITVSAPGCATNRSTPPIFAHPSQTIYLPVGLTPLPLVAFHVLVRDIAGNQGPIAGALVELRYMNLNVATGNVTPTNVTFPTGARGWVNFSGLPQSTVYVIVSATGYLTNTSATYLQYGANVSRYVVWLTPIPPVAVTPQGLRIVPSNAGQIWAVFLLPIVAILGAIVYLTILRAPERPPIEERPRPKPAAAAPAPPPPPP